MAVKTEWRCRSNLHVAIVVEIVVLVAPWLARGTSPRERGGRARQSVAWPTAMDPDHRIRAAAFVAISQLSRQFNDHVPWDAIGEGFSVAGETILFANRSKGIFKPRQMSAALSIKTTVPRFGRTTWYRDQDSSNLDGATGLLRYELARGNDPTNDALRKAWQRGAHLIYFMGVAPAVYQPVFPVWIADFSPAGRHVLLATADFLVAGQQLDQHVAAVRDSVEVSYSPNDHTYAESPGVVQRSHQGGIPKPMRFQRTTCVRELLVGAHIRADKDGGPASVQNGICISTLHHVAFDSHLIGVDPDHRIHVSRRLREDTDGELLAALKGLDGGRIRLPDDPRDHPDHAHLEHRFRQFRERR